MENSIYLTLIFTVTCLILFIIVHSIVIRLIKKFKIRISHQSLILSLFFSSIILYILIFVLILYSTNYNFQIILFSVIYFFIVYICFGYFYLHVFNLSETGRRIKIIIGALLNKKIFISNQKNDNKLEMVNNRLERLKKMEQIKINKNGMYVINKKFILYYMYFYNFIKNIINKLMDITKK